MVKIENWSKEDISYYGRLIGEAFADSPGFSEAIPRKYLIKLFIIITECSYKAKVLYALSENYEGFFIYWDNESEPSVKYYLLTAFKLIRSIPLKYVLLYSKSSGEEYRKKLSQKENYIEVFMGAFMKEYRGRGYVKKFFEYIFGEADKKSCHVVFDTDSIKKVGLFEHCGMKKVAEKNIGCGMTLHTMVYPR